MAPANILPLYVQDVDERGRGWRVSWKAAAVMLIAVALVSAAAGAVTAWVEAGARRTTAGTEMRAQEKCGALEVLGWLAPTDKFPRQPLEQESVPSDDNLNKPLFGNKNERPKQQQPAAGSRGPKTRRQVHLEL
ncbi:uncharacterized protein LOC144148533 [Haemaphysalis longicornis]